MSLKLYAHPLSSYCQKVLITLYENGTAFEYRMLSADNPDAREELAARWPLKRFPMLTDNGRTILESTIINEYLELHYPGPVRLIPEDARAALDIRLMDRFFDNYIMTPMQKIVLDSVRPTGKHDPYGVEEVKSQLDTAYAWLDDRMAGRTWVSGDSFSLADCAAAPSLFYADWSHPIAKDFPNVRAYRQRLLARQSVARVVDEARPYRVYFPLSVPDGD